MVSDEARPYDWGRNEVWRHRGEDRMDRADRRSDFERDRDRIIHSIAFRRLQGKTQIFASSLAGAMRTRLTHTLEAAQIGEAIGRRNGIPEHLTGAVCLAHDLGHPPFGHFGEAVLGRLMQPYGGFDANAQTLRVVTRLERKNRRYDGLNLTRATLLGLVKYPYRRTAPEVASAPLPGTATDYFERPDGRGPWVARRRFIYEDDEALIAQLLDGTDLQLLDATDRGAPPPRSIVCEIADWADDIAYSLHDLEDGITARFLNPDQFLDPPFVNAVWRSVNAERDPRKPEIDAGRVTQALSKLKSKLNDEEAAEDVGGLRQVTRGYINDFLLSTEVERVDESIGSLGFELIVRDDHRLDAAVFKAMTLEFLLKDVRTTRYMFKGRRMLEQLFEAFMDDPKIVDGTSDQLLGAPERRLLADDPSNGRLRARVVCDFLANQTEGHLISMYRTMFEAAGPPSLPAT